MTRTESNALAAFRRMLQEQEAYERKFKANRRPPRQPKPPRVPALIKAVKSGDTKTVRRHLDRGVDPNTTYTDPVDGTTEPLLTLAMEGEHVDLVRLLIERGADVNERKAWTYLPLEVAAGTGNVTILQFLLDAGAKLKPRIAAMALSAAVAANKIDTVRFLLDKGVRPDAYDAEMESTALELARDLGHDDIAKLLKRERDRRRRPPKKQPPKNPARSRR